MAPYTLNEGGWTAIKVTVVLMILDAVFLVLRFMSIRRVKASFGADDVWATIAFVFFLANISVVYWSIFLGGVGYPITDLTYDQTLVNLKANYISSWLNLLSLLAVKLSVLCLYRRVFRTSGFKKVTLWFGVFVTALTVLLVFAGAFRCLPVQSIWDPHVESTTCLNYTTGFLVFLVLNTITDFILLAMPLAIIKGLNLVTQKKIELAGIFLLGAGTVVASILCLISMYSGDPAEYSHVNTIVWSNVKPGVGLICACLPKLRPLFPLLTIRYVRDWYYSKAWSSSGSGYSGRRAYGEAKDQSLTSSQGHGVPQISMPEHHDGLSGNKFPVTTEVSSAGRSKEPEGTKNWAGIEVERAIDIV